MVITRLREGDVNATIKDGGVLNGRRQSKQRKNHYHSARGHNCRNLRAPARTNEVAGIATDRAISDGERGSCHDARCGGLAISV